MDRTVPPYRDQSRGGYESNWAPIECTKGSWMKGVGFPSLWSGFQAREGAGTLVSLTPKTRPNLTSGGMREAPGILQSGLGAANFCVFWLTLKRVVRGLRVYIPLSIPPENIAEIIQPLVVMSAGRSPEGSRCFPRLTSN